MRIFLGREHGIAHEFEERIDDVIARKFDVHHFFGVVNVFARHGFAVAIGVVEPIGEATNERTGEGAGQESRIRAPQRPARKRVRGH